MSALDDFPLVLPQVVRPFLEVSPDPILLLDSTGIFTDVSSAIDTALDQLSVSNMSNYF